VLHVSLAICKACLQILFPATINMNHKSEKEIKMLKILEHRVEDAAVL
jgi:hypothetical protein